MHLNNLIPANACGPSHRWLEALAEGTTPQQAWDVCERGDWLLWLLHVRNVDRRALVLCACEIARQALNHVLVGEVRPLRAIEMAEAWARGEATIQNVRAAAAAAADAAYEAADISSVAAHVYSIYAGGAAASGAAYAAAYAAFGCADGAAAGAAVGVSDADANVAAAIVPITYTAAYVAASAGAAATATDAYASATDAYSVARRASMQASANIVRKHFPQPPLK
jgi:hypothetical protein